MPLCVCFAAEGEDVLALAGMRQTAVGQYLSRVGDGGARWAGHYGKGLMVQMGHSIYILTELPTQHT